MSRPLLAVLLALLSCLPLLRAQEVSDAGRFRADFDKAMELKDEKLMDKAVKRLPSQALGYYEGLYFEKDKGRDAARALCAALDASWRRVFENADTMEKLDRWMSGLGTTDNDQYQRRKVSALKVWQEFNDFVLKQDKPAEFEKSVKQMTDIARMAEAQGNNLEIAEVWGLVAVMIAKNPDKSIANRKDGLYATEQFLNARKSWSFIADEYYLRSSDFAKFEKGKIEELEKAGDKRKGEGYDANAKGIDTLVMPNSVEAKHELKFAALPNLDELDYGPKSGPAQAFWFMGPIVKPDTTRELSWFTRRKFFLMRTGAAKFAIGFDTIDKNPVEVDVSPKAKISTFWLDLDKKQPYAMAFWVGSDHEMVNEAECNLAPNDNLANIYFRSASSWTAQVGPADAITLYDDNASGNPGDANPIEPPYKSHMLGDVDGDGTVIPLIDSMRVGKGPRLPYSEFVKLSTGWSYMKKGTTDAVGIRPLNPEYVKTGKVKLVWNGPKPTAPVQLVVQGSGDYKTAFFDVAGGKEVELPAADYHVIWGRIMIGKGARAQLANLYEGKSKPFTVEAGKVFELKMGGPFTLLFNRRGDQNAKIDATTILVEESSGCVLTELQGINLACEAVAAKDADGKGAKVYGKFVRFTDPELVNKAATQYRNLGLLTACFPMPDGYREKEMILELKLPAEGMKVGLQIKKHPLFGDIKPAWQ